MTKTAKKTNPANKLGKLPTWDLTDFYPAIDSPELAKDQAKLKRACAKFATGFEGKVDALSPAEFGKAIVAYEKIDELMGKIGCYAQLLYAGDMSNPAITQFYQNTQELLTALSSTILFFGLSINKLSDAHVKQLQTNPTVKKYAPWLRDTRVYKPHQLSDELEKLSLDMSVTSRASWVRLFDESNAALRFPLDSPAGKKMLTEAEIMSLMSDRNAEKRKQAAQSVGEVFKANAPLFSLITNTLAKTKEVEDRWRGFERPISSRNLSNYIEDEVVDALLTSVQDSYKDLSHRYYKMKAGWLGKKKIPYWDRNAPLPFSDDTVFKYKDAQTLVLDAFGEFSPTLAKTGKLFFDNNWIDVPPRKGKDSGAFSHPTVPSVHPYILLNYQGKSRDVMTLAHELGHGVHQVLAGKQGTLLCDTPLTLAETASVFGEMLTFQKLVERAKTEKQRKALIASKVEDMLNTVVRQIAFCLFEREVHDARRGGEVSTQQICDIWMRVQAESLGPAIKLDGLGGNYQYFWSYIPHFIHSPFYVYSYAFGDCLVNSLYETYLEYQAAGKGKDFEKKYIQMLEAGGTLWHKEMLAPFGLDATQPSFWNKGLAVISGYIDELEY